MGGGRGGGVDDPAVAVKELTECRDEISKLGETERLAIAGAYLARAWAAQGDLDAGPGGG